MASDESLGAMLRRLRAAAGLPTTQALAERADVPTFRLRDWEDDRRIPDLLSAYRLARALGVSVDGLAECLARQVQRGPKAPLRTAPARKRTGRKLPGKPPHRRPSAGGPPRPPQE